MIAEEDEEENSRGQRERNYYGESPQPPFAALNLAVSKRIFALWGKGGLRFAHHRIRDNSSPQSTYSKLQRSLGLSFQRIIAHLTGLGTRTRYGSPPNISAAIGKKSTANGPPPGNSTKALL